MHRQNVEFGYVSRWGWKRSLCLVGFRWPPIYGVVKKSDASRSRSHNNVGQRKNRECQK